MLELAVFRNAFLNDPLGGSLLIVTLLSLLELGVGEMAAESAGEPFDDRLLIKSVSNVNYSNSKHALSILSYTNR